MTTQTDERVEKAFNLVRNPALWPGTTTDQLVDILYSVSEWLGSNFTEELFEEFRPFYWHIAERTTIEQRLEVLVELVDGVERFEVGTASLLPFLCADEETSVISTAALHLALLLPLRDGDPLTGPKYIVSGLDSCDTENSLVGNLQGVLLLGDRRILPLLDRCWERLGREGRRLLAHSWSGFVYASTIDFLLGWLEVTDDERDYGSIAAALVLCTARQKNSPFVLDVERKFPANSEEDGPPVRFLHQWTFEEYGKIIAPRLKAIAAAETGEKVMPKVLAAWGIDDAGQPA
jgi:hypothetical protein